jgi:hypothetical protein
MSDELKQQASVESEDFDELLYAFAAEVEGADRFGDDKGNVKRARRALIAHIDAWGARMAVPDGWKLVPEVPTNEIICAIERTVDEQLVASGMWAADMQRQDGADIYDAALAAAPSPTKEQSCG